MHECFGIYNSKFILQCLFYHSLNKRYTILLISTYALDLQRYFFVVWCIKKDNSSRIFVAYLRKKLLCHLFTTRPNSKPLSSRLVLMWEPMIKMTRFYHVLGSIKQMLIGLPR